MKFPFFLFLALWAFNLCAQQASLEVRLVDATGNPLAGAAVLISTPSDSIVKSGVTDIRGVLSQSVPVQPYRLRISLIGYTDTVVNLDPVEGQFPVYRIQMRENNELLEEVQVEARAESQTISGDTTIMNAEAFKVAEDASTGDLLGKMPGVEINNGSVQAQGEEVTKVFVDGKPFFGEDSKAALDLIPAEMVKGIKIYDRQSDQARFTGFRDGETNKTLDIITKKDKRFGVFGQLNGGYGTGDTYQLNSQVNFFRNKERISFILTTDNVNGTGNGLGQFVRRRGRNIAVNNVPSGIATSWNTGLNYSNSYANGLDLQASYSYNQSDRNEERRLIRAYVLPSDSGQVYRELERSRTQTYVHNVNLDIEWQIDSNHAIEFDPNFSFSRFSQRNNTASQTRQGEELLNSNLREYGLTEDSWSLNGELLYKYAFPKKRRTLSTSLEYDNDHADATERLDALGSFINRGNDTIAQVTQSSRRSPVLSGEVVFTEPIGERGLAEFRYEVERDRQDDDRRTFNLAANDADERLDSSLSNVFQSDVYTHEYSLGYQWEAQETWSISTRLEGQNVLIDNLQDLPNPLDQERRYNAILPYAAVFYEPEETDFRLRLRYRARTDVPSIGQLQEVVINQNPLLLTTGNPDLEMSYTHDVSLRIIANDPRNSNGFFAYAAVRSTERYIGSSTRIASISNPVPGLEAGQQITQPMNLRGNWDARLFAYYGFPIWKGKLKGSARMGVRYEELPSMINLEENLARTLRPGMSAGLASNISEELDFNLSGGVDFGRIRNSLNSMADNDFRTWNGVLSAKYRPKNARLTFETDVTHIANYGLSDAFNLQYTVWNGGVGYKFLKNKRLEAKLWVFDLLGQNTSIQRSFTSTYTEDLEQLVLSRYVMFSLTYRFGKFDERRGGRRRRP